MSISSNSFFLSIKESESDIKTKQATIEPQTYNHSNSLVCCLFCLSLSLWLCLHVTQIIHWHCFPLKFCYFFVFLFLPILEAICNYCREILQLYTHSTDVFSIDMHWNKSFTPILTSLWHLHVTKKLYRIIERKRWNFKNCFTRLHKVNVKNVKTTE